MPKITRLGDNTTGHDGYPARPNTGASGNVFAEGIGINRVGDSQAVHCKKSCHGSTTASGSPNVFANGKAVGRVGDPTTCGDTIAQGASTVHANSAGQKAPSIISADSILPKGE